MPASRHKTKSSYRKTTLKNGLRVVTESLPSVRSIALGVWVDVGSRNEAADEAGVTHLIEHMLFKGTRQRNARQIASALESVGGALNAFTSRENTCFTARILDANLGAAVDLLADMTCHSTLSPSNLKLERKVICEEIKESIETPADHIHDIFAAAFWGTHPLGRPILGQRKTMMGISRTRIKKYMRRHYCSGSVVVAASGSVSHNTLVRLAREKFEFQAGAADSPLLAQRDGGRKSKVVDDGNNQTHLCLGYPGLAYTDPKRTAVSVMNAYLGGGMSSVLYQKIREEKGLAYTVYTFHDFYQDAGIFGAYMATDKDHLQQTIEISLKEFDRLKKRRLTKTRLDQVKTQIKGQMALAMESTAAWMNRLARHELMFGKYIPLSDTLKEIDKVSPSDILELANRVFDNSHLTAAVSGPVDSHVFENVA